MGRWSGAAACVILLLAGAFCLRWEYAFLHWGTNRVALLSGGGAVFAWSNDPSILAWWAPFRGIGPTITNSLTLAGLWRGYGCWPQLDSASATYWQLSIPLWMPLALIGVVTAYFWRRDQRGVKRGCCTHCGYDLTGNASGRCPECGEATGELLADAKRARENARCGR